MLVYHHQTQKTIDSLILFVNKASLRGGLILSHLLWYFSITKDYYIQEVQKMRLAEALIERADLKFQINQIENRMKENALVQEGDSSAEDVSKQKARGQVLCFL